MLIVLTDLEYVQDLSQAADFAMVFGGDGSILLRRGRCSGTHQVPVLGINMGKLGFLAGISPGELLSVLPAVCAGECRLVSHLMFTVTVLRNGEPLCQHLGLNVDPEVASHSRLSISIFTLTPNWPLPIVATA